MNGISLARIGRSEAGKRIEDAGRAFQDQSLIKSAQVSKFHYLAKKLQLLGVGLKAKAGEHKERLDAAKKKGPVHLIIEEVAIKHGIYAKDITCHRRLAWMILPRYEAMYRAMIETELSSTAIGKVFEGRDHSTIRNGTLCYAYKNHLPLPRKIKDTPPARERWKGRR